MKRWMFLLSLAFLLYVSALAEPEIVVSSENAQVGDVIYTHIESDQKIQGVVYTLTRDSETVFAGEEDTHTNSAFRPRQEGHYTLEAEIHYENSDSVTVSESVLVQGLSETIQNSDLIYSQKDGWWKDKDYSKSDLDQAGCAIFTLSHALLRMGWTGDDIEPENLAVTYKNCYTKNGTANARLVYNASQVYGYTPGRNLIKDQSDLKDGLANGDYYSFAIVIGHIALMTGVDEKAEMVRIVDSAPSATFERIKKSSLYYLKDGEYTEVRDLSEIPGSVYYFETQQYGGLEYYLQLSYCAKRGGRVIRPPWIYYVSENGKIGAQAENITSGLSEIAINGETLTVSTRELSWGEDGVARLAVVNKKKNIKLMNDKGKRIASIPSCAVFPVLRVENEEKRAYVIYDETRGYVSLSDVEIISPLEGNIQNALISVNGSTSGRATVKVRYGPSVKEKVIENWKTGTSVTLIREEGEFYLVEGKGKRVWVQKDYLTEDKE